jgi:hypothetical protein
LITNVKKISVSYYRSFFKTNIPSGEENLQFNELTEDSSILYLDDCLEKITGLAREDQVLIFDSFLLREKYAIDEKTTFKN